MKERASTVCHTLPYDAFPKLMTTSLMRNIVKWINVFPSSNSINDKYSPANIVDGSSNPEYNKKRLPFGACAMVFFVPKYTMA